MIKYHFLIIIFFTYLVTSYSFANAAVNPVNDIEITEQQQAEFHYQYYNTALGNINSYVLDNLHYIASLCPYAYGSSVYRARSELMRYGLATFADDKENCALLGYLRNMEQETKDTVSVSPVFIVTPVPTSDFLQVTGKAEADRVFYAIHDLQGLKCLVGYLSFKTKNATLYIGNLPAGYYTLSLSAEDSAMHYVKIIVTK